MLSKIAEKAHFFLHHFLKATFSKSGFLLYGRNIQWFSLARVSAIGMSIITTAIIARILGPETFGTLSYVLSFVGLFAVLSNLGIDNILYKELVLHKDKREEILGSAIALKIVTGIIAIFVCLVITTYSDQTLYIKSLIFLMSLSFLTQSFSFLGFDFLKDAEAKYTTIAQMIAQFISNVLKIIVIYYFSSLSLFISILLVEHCIVGLIYIYQIKRIKGRSLAITVKKDRILGILKPALPLTLFGAFTEIYSRIDQIMLHHYVNVTAVGLYAAATRLTEIWYTIPNILIGALFPAFINAYSSEQEYRKRVRSAMILLSVIALILSTLTILFSKTLIVSIYGQEFIGAAPILNIYALSLLGSFIGAVINIDLLAKNKVWVSAGISGFACLINVGLNIVLIPLHTTAGAAAATVISYTSIPIIYFLYTRLIEKKVNL
jgi:PST family polysaccharide transporter